MRKTIIKTVLLHTQPEQRKEIIMEVLSAVEKRELAELLAGPGYHIAKNPPKGILKPRRKGQPDEMKRKNSGGVDVEHREKTFERGSHIEPSLSHDAGAFAQCSYCQRYSDHPLTLRDQPICYCGKSGGWSGSFKPPTKDSIWYPGVPDDREGTGI